MASSTISHTLRKYRESLDVSSNRERELYEKRSKNVGVLYEKFLKNLIRRYPEKISDKKWLQEMLTKIKKMFDKKELTFVAVEC